MTISIARLKSRNTTYAFGLPLLTALRVWSERRALSQMDASRLKDIGISKAEATAESARPFWDLADRTQC